MYIFKINILYIRPKNQSINHCESRCLIANDCMYKEDKHS